MLNYCSLPVFNFYYFVTDVPVIFFSVFALSLFTLTILIQRPHFLIYWLHNVNITGNFTWVEHYHSLLHTALPGDYTTLVPPLFVYPVASVLQLLDRKAFLKRSKSNRITKYSHLSCLKMLYLKFQKIKVYIKYLIWRWSMILKY